MPAAICEPGPSAVRSLLQWALQARPVRLARGHRHWVYWIAGPLFLTGALWLAFHFFVQVDGQFGPAPHPLEHWWLRMHGAAAMAALVLVGSLLPIHVRRGWHQRRNLPLGVVLLSTVLLLTLSGYALYYFGGEEARPWISLFHWVIGLAAPVVIAWHVVSGRRPKEPVSAMETAQSTQLPRARDASGR